MCDLHEVYICAAGQVDRNKAPPIICRRPHFQILLLFHNNKQVLIFHAKRLLAADDSREIASFFSQKSRKMSQKSSTAVVGALRVKMFN